MAEHRENGQLPSLASLMGDIMVDVRALFAQQLALFRAEVKRDFAKLRTAAVLLSAGVLVLFLGTLFLLLMLVHGLQALTELPLWACYALVGAGLTAAGLGAVYVGKKRLQSVPPLPQASAQAIRDTVHCLTKLR